MNTASVFYVPILMRRYRTDDLRFYAENGRRNEWESGPSFVVNQDGEEAAEEIFDLTNNPSRYEQFHKATALPFRSVSVGDIVEVNGVDYFCDNVGWIILEQI
jgi:hypothetical protein